MGSEPSQTPASFCQECGFKLDPGTKFCPNCGTPVRNAGQHAAAAPEPLRLNGREDFLSCDYYELLGIGRGADIQEIRKAIVTSREQVASWPDSADKKSVLKRLMGAQGTLTDDDARAKYAVELVNPQKGAGAADTRSDAGKGRHAAQANGDSGKEDYYALLGISKDATVGEIHNAASEKRLQANKNPDRKEALDLTRRINAAEKALCEAAEAKKAASNNAMTAYVPVAQQGQNQSGPYYVPVPVVQQQPAANDSGSFGWAVLGFFIPLVGLILWLVWKDEKPETAKRCIHGALVSVVINVLLYLVGGCSLLALL